jgi:hypothetical protein
MIAFQVFDPPARKYRRNANDCDNYEKRISVRLTPNACVRHGRADPTATLHAGEKSRIRGSPYIARTIIQCHNLHTLSTAIRFVNQLMLHWCVYSGISVTVRPTAESA